jgi:hypothetical protein
MLKMRPVDMPTAWPFESRKEHRPPAKKAMEVGAALPHELIKARSETRVEDTVEGTAAESFLQVNDGLIPCAWVIRREPKFPPDEFPSFGGDIGREPVSQDDVPIANELFNV